MFVISVEQEPKIRIAGEVGKATDEDLLSMAQQFLDESYFFSPTKVVSKIKDPETGEVCGAEVLCEAVSYEP